MNEFFLCSVQRATILKIDILLIAAFKMLSTEAKEKKSADLLVEKSVKNAHNFCNFSGMRLIYTRRAIRNKPIKIEYLSVARAAIFFAVNSHSLLFVRHKRPQLVCQLVSVVNGEFENDSKQVFFALSFEKQVSFYYFTKLCVSLIRIQETYQSVDR